MLSLKSFLLVDKCASVRERSLPLSSWKTARGRDMAEFCRGRPRCSTWTVNLMEYAHTNTDMSYAPSRQTQALAANVPRTHVASHMSILLNSHYITCAARSVFPCPQQPPLCVSSNFYVGTWWLIFPCLCSTLEQNSRVGRYRWEAVEALALAYSQIANTSRLRRTYIHMVLAKEPTSC